MYNLSCFVFIIYCMFIYSETRVDKNIKRNSFSGFSQKRKCMYVIKDQTTLQYIHYGTAITNSKQKFHRGLPLSHSFKYMYIQLSICKQFITSNIFHVHSLYVYLIFLPVFHRYKRRTTAAFLHINVTHILITIKTVL